MPRFAANLSFLFTELQFLDQFPRTTESLGQEQGVVLDAEELVKLLREGPQQPRH